MSGGPPHHPHNRPVPVPSTNLNTAWNHRLQIPNYFPRQPQLAHMSNEHGLIHQPTWHTPTTTDTLKIHPPPHMLSEMFKNESLFPRDCVDLSVTRNGNQNGEVLSAPISLSVRDTNKINSLPASALDIQAKSNTSASPGRKSLSPGLKASSPGLQVPHPKCNSNSPSNTFSASNLLKSLSPTPGVGFKFGIQGLPASTTVDVVKPKRSNVRVDSILERLNPQPITVPDNKLEDKIDKTTKGVIEEKNDPVSISNTNTFDDNSNSSILNATIPPKDDDTISTNSNEDSLDSMKSRRKRKPSKTIRVSKDDEKIDEAAAHQQNTESEVEKDPINIKEILDTSSDLKDLIVPTKLRRKTSSESETIDDIAAMVQEGLKEKVQKQIECVNEESKHVSISVIKTNENLTEVLSDNTNNATLITAAAKKDTTTNFVEVENKLEEMFAGIEDDKDLNINTSKNEDSLLKLDESLISNTNNKENNLVKDEVNSNKIELIEDKKQSTGGKKTKRKVQSIAAVTPKQKKIKITKPKAITKKVQKSKGALKIDTVKEVYAYDSGSNASSSKTRGPFVQIKGPRDSPISVSVINSSLFDEDGDRRLPKSKKFHDDTEYRHKVRSKGLHSSTLSNKYDAQTKDTSWICAFCKRGPHASELSGPTFDSTLTPPGDLFGPYFITNNCSEFERRLDDPYDRQYKSKKITKALDAEQSSTSKPKKSKRKHSDIENLDDIIDIYLGITETNNKTYEVWAHEDCIVWSPGTYLIGTKIVGLEEAIWTCCNISCKSCLMKGANISCMRRGCLNVMHMCCARSNDWQLIDSEFKVYCTQHRIDPK